MPLFSFPTIRHIGFPFYGYYDELPLPLFSFFHFSLALTLLFLYDTARDGCLLDFRETASLLLNTIGLCGGIFLSVLPRARLLFSFSLTAFPYLFASPFFGRLNLFFSNFSPARRLESALKFLLWVAPRWWFRSGGGVVGCCGWWGVFWGGVLLGVVGGGLGGCVGGWGVGGLGCCGGGWGVVGGGLGWVGVGFLFWGGGSDAWWQDRTTYFSLCFFDPGRA